MKFKERKTAPSKSNKYYYKDNVFYQSGYGLPNCTCYAWGRAYELTGKKPNLCTANAENWYRYTKDGYERGKTPKLGAVIVWSKGKIGRAKDGAGHVAIVEHINNDGSFVTSNSAHKGRKFYQQTIPKSCKLKGYKFEGFIYCPISFSKGKTYPGKFPTLPKRGYFKKGDTGVQVRLLQEFLCWANDKNIACDGIAGKNTVKAVKTFQKNVKIGADGKFGKKSLEKAKQYKK